MADLTGSFSGSIESLDYSGIEVYSGSTFGFFLHQRAGTDAERVDVADFYETYLESDPFQLYASPSGGRDPGHYIIIRSGSDAIRTAPLKDFFGGYTERVDVNNRHLTFLYSRGVGRNSNTGQETWGVKLLTLNGETVYDYWNTPGRLSGLTLTILDGGDFDVISTTNYDTSVNVTDANNLAAAIDNLTPQEIGIITSLGYWETNVTDTLRSSSRAVGLTKLGAYTGAGSGSAYTAVFTGASGSNANKDAVEKMSVVGIGTGSKDIPVATLALRLQSNKQNEYNLPIIDGAMSTNALYAFGPDAPEDPVLWVDGDGNLVGDVTIESSSYAETASFALNAGEGGAGIFEQTGSYYATTNDLQVTGSFDVLGSGSFEHLTVLNTTTINGVTYFWPGSDGLDQQVLTTDGSGNLTWTAKISGSVDSASFATTAESASYATTASYSEVSEWAGLNDVPSGLVSSSDQVDHDQTTNYVAGEHFLQSQITEVGTVTSGDVSAILPAGTVSSSQQINTGSFTGSFVGDGSELINIQSASFATTASYAANVELPSGTVSSSGQIDHDSTTNYVAGEHFLQSAITEVGTVTSGDVSAILPSGTVSSSGQIDGTAIQNNTVNFGGVSVALGGSDTTPAFDLSDATNYSYDSLTNIPNGIVSSSTQFDDLTNPFSGSFTGSFVGDGSGLTGISSDDAVSASYAETASYASNVFFDNINNKPSLVSASSQVEHDSTTGFVVNEHINHTSVTLTAGDGLDGGGDITTDRSFAVDSTVLRTTGDNIVSASSQVDHDATTNYVAGEHFLQSAITEVGTVTSGDVSAILPSGLVSSSQQINTGSFTGSFVGDGSELINIQSASFATTASYAANVELPSGTVSSSGQVDHDATTNYDAAEHFLQSAITTVGTVTSGDVSAILPAGTVSASSQIDHDQTTNYVAGEHFLQSNITTVGTVTSGDVSAILPVGTVSASSQIDHDSTIGFVANEHINHTSVTLTAGDGLDGGGDITVDRSFAVDATVLRTTGDGVISSSAQISPIDSASYAETASYAANVVTINNDSANRLVTARGDGDLDAENLLTFNGSTLAVNADIAMNTDQDFIVGDGSGNEFIISKPVSTDGHIDIYSGDLLILSASTEFVRFDTSDRTVSGSFKGDGSGLTGVIADSVDYTDITNKPTLVSSSSQIDHDSTTNYVAGEHFLQSNITTVGTVTSGDVSAILPSGTVSSSQQINTGSFTGSFNGTFAGESGSFDYLEIIGSSTRLNNVLYFWPATDGDSGEVLTTDGNGNLDWTPASSASVASASYAGNADELDQQDGSYYLNASNINAGTLGNEYLPSGIVSSSSQIDHDATTNYVAGEHFLQSNITTVGTVTSGDVSAILPTGTVSSSGQIDHDSTNGFVANEHINHTSVTLTAGDGLSGGGTIAADRSFAVDATVLRTTGDSIVSASSQIDHDATTNFVAGEHFLQSAITTVGTVTSGDVSAILPTGTVSASSQVDHDSTTGFVANEHIDHTGVTITAGYGLSGGGDIASSLSLAVDFAEFATITALSPSVDYFPVLDNGAHRRILIQDVKLDDLDDSASGLVSSSGQIDHDQTINYDAAEHFLQSAITTVGTVTSGDVSAILPVGTVSSSVQIDHDSTTNYVTGEHFLQSAITTVGTVTSGDVSAILPTGTVSSSVQIDHDSTTGFVANEHIDHTGVTITAGNGLSGGGDIASSFSLAADFTEFATITSLVGTDQFPVLDAGAHRRINIENVDISLFNNDAGYITGSSGGDITEVIAGSGLSGGGDSGSVTLNVNAGTGLNILSDNVVVDLSELTDMTADMIGTDEFIVLDAGTDRRKAANEIDISIFNNDAGYAADQTITAGTGLSGGGTGDVSLALDLSELATITIPQGTDRVAITDASSTNASRTIQFQNIDLSVFNNDIGIVSASSQIDHDATTNYDSAEHFTQANITTVGTVTTGDVSAILPIGTVSSSGQIDHDSTNGFVANEHIDHSSVSITPGLGLTGGGTIAATRTLDVDLTEFATVTSLVGTDQLPVLDAGVQRKINIENVDISLFNNDLGIISSSSQIDHDQTTNFNSNEHFLQSAITTVGTVTSGDVSAILPTGLVSSSGQIDHDSTTGFVANEHINHNNIDITAGYGLSGGGRITGSFSIASDFTEFATITSMVGTDQLPVLDAGAHRRINIENVDVSLFNNDAGYTSNAGDITGVTAGSGLTGGGTSGGVTLNIGQGDGISVTADAVAVNSSVLRTTGDSVVSSSGQIDHDATTNYVAGEHFLQSNITTVGTVTSGDVSSILPVGTVSSSGQIDHDQTLNYEFNRHVNHATITFTAGSGLTGGGTLAGSRTFNVGEGDGISVTADAVAVDSTVLRTTGDSVVSSSAFSAPSQGTLRATLNGVNEDTDLGLQTGDSPTFAGLSLTGNLDMQDSDSIDLGTGNDWQTAHIGGVPGTTFTDLSAPWTIRTGGTPFVWFDTVGGILSGSFEGDGSAIEGVVSSSYAVTASYAANAGGIIINNDANNRITTAQGDGDLNAEANLTFDGTTLTLSGADPQLIPDTDNTGDVGTLAATWNQGYFTNMYIDSTLNVRGAIDLSDNDELRFGASDDYIIDFNGSHLLVHQNVSTAHDILFTNTADGVEFTFDMGVGEGTATDWIATSDIRLKDVQGPVLYGLETVKKMDPITYKWNEKSEKNDDRDHLGFSAQDMMDVVPEVVRHNDDDTYGIAYDKLVPVLVNAIKELSEQNETLMDRLERLEEQVNGQS